MMRWLRRLLERFDVGPDVYSVSFWEPVEVTPARRVERDGRTYEYEATLEQASVRRLRADLDAQLRAWLLDHDPGATVSYRSYGHDVEADGTVRVKMTAFIEVHGSAFPRRTR